MAVIAVCIVEILEHMSLTRTKADREIHAKNRTLPVIADRCGGVTRISASAQEGLDRR